MRRWEMHSESTPNGGHVRSIFAKPRDQTRVSHLTGILPIKDWEIPHSVSDEWSELFSDLFFFYIFCLNFSKINIGVQMLKVITFLIPVSESVSVLSIFSLICRKLKSFMKIYEPLSFWIRGHFEKLLRQTCHFEFVYTAKNEPFDNDQFEKSVKSKKGIFQKCTKLLTVLSVKKFTSKNRYLKNVKSSFFEMI